MAYHSSRHFSPSQRPITVCLQTPTARSQMVLRGSYTAGASALVCLAPRPTINLPSIKFGSCFHSADAKSCDLIRPSSRSQIFRMFSCTRTQVARQSGCDSDTTSRPEFDSDLTMLVSGFLYPSPVQIQLKRGSPALLKGPRIFLQGARYNQ